ncbi:MAG TPA: hypothetical protein H9677_03395, partial [Firmicutes bacterium]|nr:hypothetical protein [Bacillota bacterium]
MLCFQRNWFRADLCEMARSCSKLQQVDKLCKYAENSTIKVFYWGPLRVPVPNSVEQQRVTFHPQSIFEVAMFIDKLTSSMKH